uniref:Cytochrome P450 n=1 Tax=Physcomitrium patens TaxID=3218 RepID=A0A2K1JE46_PHYPA|nr:hypothetical protein PHYPA_020085 [Physcomitrium patens]
MRHACQLLPSWSRHHRHGHDVVLLGAHQPLEVEQNILAEISATHNSSSVAACSSFDELKSMHYLQAALFESMRLHPSIPADQKVAASDDVWPDGTVIRKGETAGYSPYIMGRMEALWGPDVMEYKPERWLKDGVFVPENSYKFPVFQARPRICLGKDMGIMTMKLIAASAAAVHAVGTRWIPELISSVGGVNDVGRSAGACASKVMTRPRLRSGPIDLVLHRSLQLQSPQPSDLFLKLKIMLPAPFDATDLLPKSLCNRLRINCRANIIKTTHTN